MQVHCPGGSWGRRGSPGPHGPPRKLLSCPLAPGLGPRPHGTALPGQVEREAEPCSRSRGPRPCIARLGTRVTAEVATGGGGAWERTPLASGLGPWRGDADGSCRPQVLRSVRGVLVSRWGR